MWFGTYSLELYCDNDSKVEEYYPDLFKVLVDRKGHLYKEFPHQFLGDTDKRCFARARKAGWVFKRDGRVLCPKCSGKKGVDL